MTLLLSIALLAQSWCQDVQLTGYVRTEGGTHTYDGTKALKAGLRCRPFERTVADTLDWDAARGRPELKVGIPPDKEKELLEDWRSRSGED